MSINKIDKLLDNVLDDFYLTNIVNDKIINKLTESGDNLVKNHQFILEEMHKYVETIDKKAIQKLVVLESNVTIITECIGKYLLYYLFLQIKHNYKANEKTFINNLLEISKNKSNFTIQFNGFFDAISNRNIINLMHTITQINELLESNDKKLEKIRLDKDKKSEYIDSFKLLNQLGEADVDKYFRSSDKQRNIHSIIKTVILLNIYTEQDKKGLSQILEDAINSKEEFIYIDVIVPKNIVVTYDSIEKLLSEKQRKNNSAGTFYDLIEEESKVTNILSKHLTIDEKISLLLESKLIIPIVDNFVLYHKDSEKYESQKSTMKLTDKKKQLTKVKYIVDKIDNIAKYNSKLVTKDNKIDDNITKDEHNKIEQEWYLPKVYSQYVSINQFENISIYAKIMTADKSMDNSEYYQDFYEYFLNSYINFKEPKENAFRFDLRYDLNKPINLIRNPIAKGMELSSCNNSIHYLTQSANKQIDIVGFLFKPSNIPVQCVKLYNDCFIKTGADSYNTFIDKISSIVKFKGNNFKPFIWLFDNNVDFKLESYEAYDNLSKSELSKLITAQIYDKFEELVFVIIEDILSQHKVTLQFALQVINTISNILLPINKKSEYYTKLQELLRKSIIKVDNKEDDYENKIIPSTDIIKLQKPSTLNQNKSIKVLIKSILINKDIKTDDNSIIMRKQYVCQHNITWNIISSMKKENPNKFSGILEEFMKRFVITSSNNENLCKSCGCSINIKEYDIDGSFDTTTGQFKTYGFSLQVPLEELPIYKNYKLVIRKIDSIIEKIALQLNIQMFYGNKQYGLRLILVKNIIDVILENNKIITTSSNTEPFNGQDYGIIKGISDEFKAFELTDLIYDDSSNKSINMLKRNLILSYIIVAFILELNDTHISLLKLGSKICNFETFENKTKQLLDKNKVITNKSMDMENINNYLILSYIIYYFSCNIIKYDLWHFNIENSKDKTDNKTDKTLMFLRKMKIVIDYIMATLTSILYNYSTNVDSEILSTFVHKYFTRLNTVYHKEKTIVTLKKKIIDIKNVNPDFLSEQLDLFTDYKQNLDLKIYPKLKNNQYKPQKRKEIKITHNNTNYIQNKIQEFRNKNKNFKFICNLVETNTLNNNTSNNTSSNTSNSSNSSSNNTSSNSSNSKDDFNTKSNLINKDLCKRLIKGDINDEDYNNYLQFIKLYAQPSDTLTVNYEKLATDYERKINVLNKINIQHSNSDSDSVLSNFINTLNNVLGSDVKEARHNLNQDKIEITRDHQGFHMRKHIIVYDDLENPKKIKYENHIEDIPELFKSRKVMIYRMNDKIDVLYDKITNTIIGYKDTNKIITSTKSGVALTIEYSIKNKLKYLGCNRNYFNISINDIFIERITNLKNAITTIKRLYNSLFYKQDKKQDKKRLLDLKGDNELTADETIIHEYRNKLRVTGIKEFLNDIDSIFIITPTLLNESKYKKIESHVDMTEIIKKDKNANTLLYYLINEIVKLINSYENRIAKINIINFLIEAINYAYTDTNSESINNNLELKQFKYRLNGSGYVYDNEEVHYLQDIINDNIDSEGELIDSDLENDEEKITDDKEEADALDIDDAFNQEDKFENGDE